MNPEKRELAANAISNFDKLKLDYEKTSEYFHMLHEVRFKLLAFLPVLSTIAIALIPKLEPFQQILIGIAGIIIIAGFTIYDQRNTQIYDRLTKRLIFLEKLLKFESLPSTSEKKWGGAFTDRPERGKILWLKLIWHDFAVAIVYSVSFTLWSYVLFDGIGYFYDMWLPIWGIISIIFIGFFFSLLVLGKRNDRENDEIKKRIDLK